MRPILILFVCGVLLAPPAAAETPAEFIGMLGSRAIKELTAKDLPQAEREAKFRQLLNEHFDVPAIGRFVLGRYWKVATDEQKAEYLALFEDFIVRSYAVRFRGYSGETFAVKGSSPGPRNATFVHSKVLHGSAEPVRVDWRVETRGDKNVITDIIVEGVSMSVTQRSEFASVIQGSGGKVEALLDALRNKTISVEQSAAQ
jgi:phospholipid transport system substrate-binding protein